MKVGGRWGANPDAPCAQGALTTTRYTLSRAAKSRGFCGSLPLNAAEWPAPDRRKIICADRVARSKLSTAYSASTGHSFSLVSGSSPPPCCTVGDQHLGGRQHFQPRLAGNPHGAFANCGGVQVAVREEVSAQAFDLALLTQVCAGSTQLAL